MMKVNVLFFANFKELLHCSNIEVELHTGASVAELCQFLSQKGDAWLTLFGNAAQVKVAVNQQMADLSVSLNDNDEVAFFPPVTGG